MICQLQAGVEPIVLLCGSHNVSVQRCAAIAIGNIACSAENRTILGTHGAVEALFRLCAVHFPFLPGCEALADSSTGDDDQPGFGVLVAAPSMLRLNNNNSSVIRGVAGNESYDRSVTGVVKADDAGDEVVVTNCVWALSNLAWASSNQERIGTQTTARSLHRVVVTSHVTTGRFFTELLRLARAPFPAIQQHSLCAMGTSWCCTLCVLSSTLLIGQPMRCSITQPIDGAWQKWARDLMELLQLV